MRRPHPRFDEARNAWVTRAGGKLTFLSKGPKNSVTESAAWDAFYVHMAKLGTPVEQVTDSVAASSSRQPAWVQGE